LPKTYQRSYNINTIGETTVPVLSSHCLWDYASSWIDAWTNCYRLLLHYYYYIKKSRL